MLMGRRLRARPKTRRGGRLPEPNTARWQRPLAHVQPYWAFSASQEHCVVTSAHTGEKQLPVSALNAQRSGHALASPCGRNVHAWLTELLMHVSDDHFHSHVVPPQASAVPAAEHGASSA